MLPLRKRTHKVYWDNKNAFSLVSRRTAFSDDRTKIMEVYK